MVNIYYSVYLFSFFVYFIVVLILCDFYYVVLIKQYCDRLLVIEQHGEILLTSISDRFRNNDALIIRCYADIIIRTYLGILVHTNVEVKKQTPLYLQIEKVFSLMDKP